MIYDVSSSVIYADFEFYIDDNSSHRSIMLLYLTVSRILIMDTQLGIFHTPHENEDDFHPFVESMVKFHENVTTYLFKE